MRMKALGANGPSFRTRGGSGESGGSVKPSNSPPPTAAPVWRKVRRESSRRMGSVSCRMLDRGADAWVGAAAADVTPQRRVYVGVGRVRLGREQRRGGHDLAGLTGAALHHVPGEPPLLRRPPPKSDRHFCPPPATGG